MNGGMNNKIHEKSEFTSALYQEEHELQEEEMQRIQQLHRRSCPGDLQSNVRSSGFRRYSVSQ